jgi:transcriptional regulator with XRE-family HTH domain
MAVVARSAAAYCAPAMITGPQIRAGRALVGWTSDQLAKAAGVSYATVSRSEQAAGVPGVRATILAAMQSALEGGGVVFLDPGDVRDGGPGVRLKR